MVNFTELTTPPNHGDVLVMPSPREWASSARAHGTALRRADRVLAGSTLSDWRRRTREAIVGSDDALVIVLGHQPDFIHPGVWAKHIVAARAAEAVDGIALDLIVDSDSVKRSHLAIPSLKGERVTVEPVRFADVAPGFAYEQIERQTPERIARFARSTRDAMGSAYTGSQMPRFLDALASRVDARDWVDQYVGARQAIEAGFGIAIQERRISELWCSPLVLDMLQHACEFATAYNRALASYRVANGIRGTHRPMPDLVRDDVRCELPLWAHDPQGVRRRLFVAEEGSSLRLLAGQREIGVLDGRCLHSCEDLEAAFAELGGWQLRPRALALTIWARLLLADLFVHGIGGAKYDRISDAIMADYYGLTPPRMACVSATLHMDIPPGTAMAETVRRCRHAVRDVQWNPQRHVSAGHSAEALIEQHAEAIRRAQSLRHHAPRDRLGRRNAFDDIRRASAALLKSSPNLLAVRKADLDRAIVENEQRKIARGRESFFGLYDTNRLVQLLDALPAAREFRV